jgi:hypothetical protein
MEIGFIDHRRRRPQRGAGHRAPRDVFFRMHGLRVRIGAPLWLSWVVLIACTPFRDDPPDGGAPPAPRLPDAPSTPAAARSCNLDAPFDPPIFVGVAGLQATWVGGMRLSPDEDTACLYANPAGAGQSDLYAATRRAPSAAFTGATPLGGDDINTPDIEMWPTIRGDGLLLVFERHPVLLGLLGALHYARRSSTAAPFVYAGVLTALEEATPTNSAPFLREDGSVLYFAKQRAGADTHIYRAIWTGQSFEDPEPVVEVNSSASEGSAVVSPDDRLLYFASSRPDADGGDPTTYSRIWVARRADAQSSFGAPVLVGELDGHGVERIPSFVTRDGCRLYFESYVLDGENPYGAFTEYVAEKPPP